jgi:hypothetical protein
VELDDKNLYRWSSDQTTEVPVFDPSEGPHFLQISGWTLKVLIDLEKGRVLDPIAYDGSSWDSFPGDRPKAHMNKTPVPYQERGRAGSWLDAVVLSYESENLLATFEHWQTRLVLLILEEDENCFRRIGIVTAWFRTPKSITISANYEEAMIGSTKLVTRRFRLG